MDMDNSPDYVDITAEKQNVPNEPLYFELAAGEQSEHGMEINPVFTSKANSGAMRTETATPLYDLPEKNFKPCNLTLSPNPMYKPSQMSNKREPTDNGYSHIAGGISQEKPDTYGRLERPEENRKEQNTSLPIPNESDNTLQPYSQLKVNRRGKKNVGIRNVDVKKASHTDTNPDKSYTTLLNNRK
jgi:hypothetical protein